MIAAVEGVSGQQLALARKDPCAHFTGGAPDYGLDGPGSNPGGGRVGVVIFILYNKPTNSQ